MFMRNIFSMRFTSTYRNNDAIYLFCHRKGVFATMKKMQKYNKNNWLKTLLFITDREILT